ncbi:peptide ABC transporter substrate-binding protein [Secundilactobacillus similis DSM 23365 = JCM 2765]|uniref:ABC transporter periplasmic protein n=1 Tax=Secundilactobacillus similis DSM 23365 = JCM 2765 TaxID=1423804 RepID=A0A0R2F0F7_9LACO|nr:peptide ABC transporter substrate-binding protein [Secundilactobacillus similis]KRN21779.1 ABC transporter periplasmic protein [Secundilactobacillus similis DSM 23365 = JCM 2765]
MKLNRMLTVTLGAASIALLLGACGSKSSSSSSKQVVTMPADAQLSTMDLSKSTAVATFNTLNNTNEGLYRLGKDSKAEPGMATKETVSKDGLTYTFNIRKNTKWSNGDALTAADFVYSWKRTVNPKTGSQYGYLFSGIKNADAIMNNKMAASKLGIKALGKYKLQITLEKQIPYFKLLLGFPVFYPQDQKVVEKWGSQYGTRSNRLVYNGPFKLAGWNGTGNTWKLVKNNNYWDKKSVKLNGVDYQVVKDKQTGLNQYNQKKLTAVNLSGQQAKNLKSNSDYIERMESSCYYLSLNQKMKLFKNKKIRQAFSMAVNRNTLVNKVLNDGSINTGSFVSKGLAVNPKTGKDFTADATMPATVKYNPTKAKQLWKEGLQELGMSGKTIKLTLLAGDDDSTKQVTQYLQSNLQKNLPGLKITNNNLPSANVLAKQSSHSFQITLSDWFADFSDPITFLNILTTGNSSNQSQWSNKEYDKLIKASSTTDASNPEARWNDMVKAQNVLLDDAGIAPLYQSSAPWLMNSKLKDLVYNTAGANYNFKTAYFK